VELIAFFNTQFLIPVRCNTNDFLLEWRE